jgi:hypothetical protein
MIGFISVVFGAILAARSIPSPHYRAIMAR